MSLRLQRVRELLKREIGEIIRRELPFSEAGIVYLERRPFAYAVMTSLMRDAVNPIPALASILFRHYDRLSHGNLYGNQVH